MEEQTYLDATLDLKLDQTDQIQRVHKTPLILPNQILIQCALSVQKLNDPGRLIQLCEHDTKEDP